MKKIYSTPVVQVNETSVQNMMAVSLMEKEADPNEEVLDKEFKPDADWNIWGE